MPRPECSVLILFLAFAIAGLGAKIFINIANDGEKSELGSLWCHEDLMRNFTEQVLKLQSDQTIALLQLGALQDSLRHIRALLARQSLTSEWQQQTLPSSCAEALGSSGDDGVHRIYLPVSGLEPFSVYCLRDPRYGGAPWTVVQRRRDGTTDFYRGWDSYRRGFGSAAAEYFVGLERLHALTHSAEQELWIQLEDFEGEQRHARYASFAIGDERAKFALDVLGAYWGDAGDSLSGHFGQKFSTKDADNDVDVGHCAIAFNGAWWYKGCHLSNLNGQYLRGPNDLNEKAKGIQWHSWHGDYSLKYVHMAIRPTVALI